MNRNNEYTVVQKKFSDWDDFAKKSKAFTVFSTSDFLDCIGSDWSAWVVLKKDQPILGATVQSPSGQQVPFRMYNGILPLEDPSADYETTKTSYQYLLNTAAESSLNGTLVFSLHNKASDLRGIKWWADDTSAKADFTVKYAAVIKRLQSKRFEDYNTALGTRRRRDYRRALDASLSIEECNDVSILLDLHAKSLSRHSAAQNDSDVTLISRLSRNTLVSRMGELLIAKSRDGQPLSAILWTRDHQSGYVLFWGNHPMALTCGSSTFLIFDIVRRCRALGLKELDLGGMNSYGRSIYKGSLGAKPVPFHEVSIRW